MSYHNRQSTFVRKICSLLRSLDLSTYSEVAPKVEYWIEYSFTEHSTTVDELVEGVSPMAWGVGASCAFIVQFLKEFRDAPHRSEKAKSFVDELCSHILRWFAAASAQDAEPGEYYNASGVAICGGNGFARVASFVGYLIECGLLSHELVRRHLVKPLISHHYADQADARTSGKATRANAIYRLFVAARNTLLQGLLEPDDVQACFKALDANTPFKGVMELDAAKINELREFHATWLKQKEGKQRGATVREPWGELKDTMAAEVPAEVETPIAFIPKNLPAATIDIDVPSSVSRRNIASLSILRDAESSSETFVNIPTTALSSPTFSVSAVSDLTSTDFSGEIEHSEEQTATRHDTFYFEDGNTEILCGGTVFRVHSTVISFSSSKLRDLLSPSTLLNAPMPAGRPRIAVSDSAEDFAVLLKMIYTPGFPARKKVPEFSVFAPLLRMVTKYGFSDVREHLIEDLKGAYPTKWEDFEAAKVLGENVFGSPKPHPNAVLNLFLQQSVKFALPFAAYRASLGGLLALVGDEPSTALPRPTLASITNGIGMIRQAVALAVHDICTRCLGVCAEGACALKVSADHLEALKIFGMMFARSEGGPLAPLSLGTLVCMACAKRLEKVHLGYRKELVWPELPSLLGWESWEEVEGFPCV